MKVSRCALSTFAFHHGHLITHNVLCQLAEAKRSELKAVAAKQAQLERAAAIADAAADALLAEEAEEKKVDAACRRSGGKKKNKKEKPVAYPKVAAKPSAVTESPPSKHAAMAPSATVEPTEAEVAKAARAEAERAVELEALQVRVREVVQAAKAQAAALPALAAEPEGASERLASEKRADQQAERIAALEASEADLKTQQSDREKRLVTKLMAAREQVTEHAAQVAKRGAQLAERDARIAALEASAAKAKTDWDDERLCVVCLDERRTRAFAPCSHLCACEGCADNIMAQNKECPICCREASSIFQIYVS